MSGLPNSHLRLVNEAIRSANALAGARMNAEKACNTSLAQAGWEPTSVQSGILSDLVARLSDVGEPPEMLREEDALRDLAGASYLYGEANHLAEFDPDKIKIFTRALTPRHYKQFIERSEEEISALYPVAWVWSRIGTPV